jgi:hypothetical protein
MTRSFATFLLGLFVLTAVPAAAEPVCGDVNNSSTVTSSDALLVLRKGVGQNVTLDCSAFTGRIEDCQTELGTSGAALEACQTGLSAAEAALAACQAAASCGNGTVELGEDCEAGDLGGATCVGLGFAGGSLACSSGCSLDSSGCWSSRFDASGPTILDRQTGLEWEKKVGADGSADYDNPHDVDNVYSWSADAADAPDGGVHTEFLRRLNSAWSVDGDTTTGCHAGHCDWRLPTIEELRTINFGLCNPGPCVVDPVFLPTVAGVYWSASSSSRDADLVWGVHFFSGGYSTYEKVSTTHARAVRGGSAGSALSCPGPLVLGRCWFLGEEGATCTATCAANGSIYDSATQFVAGSQGSNAACQAVLDAIGAPGSGLDFPSHAAANGLGCMVDAGNARARVSTPTTSAGAFGMGIRRACACL